MMRRIAASLLLAGIVVSGCRPDDQRTDTIDPASDGRASFSAETLAQIDSGNAAYRRGDFEAAAAAFSAVTEAVPDDATGWFGLYMAYQELGRTEAADSALARARAIAPGASLIRPPSGDEGGAS